MRRLHGAMPAAWRRMPAALIRRSATRTKRRAPGRKASGGGHPRGPEPPGRLSPAVASTAEPDAYAMPATATGRSGPRERVDPADLAEAGEVGVGGADLQAVLHRDGREVGVGQQVAGEAVAQDEV